MHTSPHRYTQLLEAQGADPLPQTTHLYVLLSKCSLTDRHSRCSASKSSAPSVLVLVLCPPSSYVYPVCARRHISRRVYTEKAVGSDSGPAAESCRRILSSRHTHTHQGRSSTAVLRRPQCPRTHTHTVCTLSLRAPISPLPFHASRFRIHHSVSRLPCLSHRPEHTGAPPSCLTLSGIT